jgi:L-lactate utilization protein LutB
MKEKIENAIKALNRHGFKAEFIADEKDAVKQILSRIPKGAKVGIPGSKTIRQLGLDRALRERGGVTFDHWVDGLSKEESLRIRKEQLTCDVLLTSANAITEEGELYSMDGIGNRAAAMVFGPGRVVIVAGVNKLVKDVRAARKRLKKVAAPMRAAELKLNTPCVKAGKCKDCNKPDRICRAEVILRRAPALTEIEVYLVGKDLGN